MALVIIVPVTVKKLPAMNEKYAMAEELENNVLQNYVRASALAKEKKNPDKIRNLKVTGQITDKDFYFMRDSMAILEAVNLKEVRVKATII